MRTAAAIAGLALAAPTLPLQAQRFETNARFAVVWYAEGETATHPVTVVQPGGSLSQMRVLPAALYINDVDVYDDHDRLVLPAESELAAAENSGGWVMACVINGAKVGVRFRQRFTANLRNTCLIDSDRDGVFDRYSLYASAYFSLGAMGRVRHMEGLRPARYRTAETSTSRDSPSLEVRLTSLGSRHAIFRLCVDFSLSPRMHCLSPEIRVDMQAPQPAFDLLGGRFAVIRDGENRLRLRAEAPFRRTPMHISNWLTR